MAHWFEADYGVTLAATGVGTVLDRSGNNRTLTGASGTGVGGAANPTLVTGGAGGRPFFKFVSANSQKFTFSQFNPGTSFYTCVVVQGALAASNVEMWTFGAVNHQISCSAGNAGITTLDGTNTTRSVAQDVSTKVGLIECVMTAGVAGVRYNGATLGMAVQGGWAGANFNTIGLVVTFFSDMNLYAGLMYTTVPSATQQLQLQEYFREKYALF